MTEPRDDELVARLTDYLDGYARHPRPPRASIGPGHRIRVVAASGLASVAVVGTLVIAFAVGHSHNVPPPATRNPAPVRSSAISRAPAAAATAPPVTPCVQTPLPPPASRLASPRDYLSDIHLTVVAPAVRPKVSAGTAFARAGYWYHPGTGSCGLTETLAYWSSDTPATIPPECVPPATLTTPWAAPSNCPSTPIYHHVLAWVFTWRSDCHSTGGPAPLAGASPRPVPSWPPLACTSITFVDATTGAHSDYLMQGGL